MRVAADSDFRTSSLLLNRLGDAIERSAAGREARRPRSTVYWSTPSLGHRSQGCARPTLRLVVVGAILVVGAIVVGLPADDIEVLIELHVDLAAVIKGDLDFVIAFFVADLRLADHALPGLRRFAPAYALYATPGDPHASEGEREHPGDGDHYWQHTARIEGAMLFNVYMDGRARYKSSGCGDIGVFWQNHNVDRDIAI